MVKCWHCKVESSAAHYARIVENKTALHGPWEGWRMAGRFLVAPGNAGRITPERLAGILWEERARLAQQRRRSVRIEPSVLPAREVFRGQA